MDMKTEVPKLLAEDVNRSCLNYSEEIVDLLVTAADGADCGSDYIQHYIVKALFLHLRLKSDVRRELNRLHGRPVREN
jgi:hypothetical protein